MADKKVSEMSLISAFTVDMYIPVIDPNEALAEDRNKRFTLAQLFGAVTTSTSTSLTLSTYPHLYLFNGSSTATWTLVEGTDDLVGIPIYVCNIGTAILNIQGGGSPQQEIDGSDPFVIPNGDTTKYTFTWNGSKWLVS